MATLGLVVAGGAARGAYEAGVMRFIWGDLARRLGPDCWPKVVSGTSVGALNAMFMVAQDRAALRRLTELWQELQISHIYDIRSGGLFAALRATFGTSNHPALLDASPLYRLVKRESPRRLVRAAIDDGRVRAFIVSATQLESGLNTLFVDSAASDLDLQTLPGACETRVRIDDQHLLASAAIPFLFPPIRVCDHFYLDGGLRQNTPLRPVIRAGASHIMVLGTSLSFSAQARRPLDSPAPTLPFLAGKTLNALMADPVERDIMYVEERNAMLDWGVEVYGEEFAARAASALGWRPVRTLFLTPSVDLGRLANATFHRAPPTVAAQVRWLLSIIADKANDDEGESDFLSDLYFDREYTGQIEAIGYADARDREEEIANFLLSATQAAETETFEAAETEPVEVAG